MTRKKISFDRASTILCLHYEHAENGITKIGYNSKNNTYTVTQNNGFEIIHTEADILAMIPTQNLSKVKKGMYAHWFKISITDDDREAAQMLDEYLRVHPKARVEGFFRKYDGRTFAKYFRLVAEENYQDLELSFDTGYSPIHYCKQKPSNLFKMERDVNEYIKKYSKTEF